MEIWLLQPNISNLRRFRPLFGIFNKNFFYEYYQETIQLPSGTKFKKHYLNFVKNSNRTKRVPSIKNSRYVTVPYRLVPVYYWYHYWLLYLLLVIYGTVLLGFVLQLFQQGLNALEVSQFLIAQSPVPFPVFVSSSDSNVCLNSGVSSPFVQVVATALLLPF